jgi:hypothetical protein
MSMKCRAEHPLSARRPGDRVISCGLPAGHGGGHMEDETEIEWPPAAREAAPAAESLDLDAIRARVPTHYDAPWRVEYLEASADDADRWLVGYATDNPLAGLVAAVPDYGEDLAEFIAHARTDVPALLAALARSRAANQALGEQHQAAVNGLADLASKLHDAHAAILDIDAHATPYGDIPDEPGWIGTYLVTAGALHRALGKVGHSAPKCQAEADLELMRQAVDAQRELRRVAEEKLIAVAATVERVRALAEDESLRSDACHDCGGGLVEPILLRAALATADARPVDAGTSEAGTAGTVELSRVRGYFWRDADGVERVLHPSEVRIVLDDAPTAHDTTGEARTAGSVDLSGTDGAVVVEHAQLMSGGGPAPCRCRCHDATGDAS